MIRRKVQKCGGSNAAVIPATFMQQLGLKNGSPISIELKNNKIIIVPLPVVQTEEAQAETPVTELSTHEE